MGNVPSSGRITGIGRVVLQLCRIYIYFYGGTGYEKFSGGYRTKQVLFINVLGHIINPTGPTAGIPIDKGTLVVVLCNEAFKLRLVGIGAPSNVMDVFIDGTHQNL